MKRRVFKSYPAGAGMAGGSPSHLQPIVGVDVDWTLANGNRAQRRRILRELQRQMKSGAAR